MKQEFRYNNANLKKSLGRFHVQIIYDERQVRILLFGPDGRGTQIVVI